MGEGLAGSAEEAAVVNLSPAGRAINQEGSTAGTFPAVEPFSTVAICNSAHLTWAKED